MKILTKSTFLRRHTPPKCCYSASFGILWTHIDVFSGQKLDFKMFSFSPIIKSMISLYNLKKGGEARFSTGKFYFFCSGLIYGIYSHGCGGKKKKKVQLRQELRKIASGYTRIIEL